MAPELPPVEALLLSRAIEWHDPEPWIDGRWLARGWTPADGADWYGIRPAGLVLIDEWSEEPYRMVHITARAEPAPALVTYAEGDVSIEVFASVDAFEAGMERAREFYTADRWPAVLELDPQAGTVLRPARSWIEWATAHPDHRALCAHREA